MAAKAETKEGITQTLANWIYNLAYEDLQEKIKDLAKNRILDSLSAAYGGRNLVHSRTAIEIAKNNPGNATVWASGVKANPLYAAMVNGALAHSTIQHDAPDGIPSTMVIPAALVMGEQEKSSGKEVLAAVVCGYEMTSRLSRSVQTFVTAGRSPFRIISIFGTMGPTAATESY